MQIAVLRDELALHETHVGLKRQWGAELRARSQTSDAVQPDVPLEIGDLRGLVERGKRHRRRLSRKMVNEDAKRRNATGYGPGSGALALSLAGFGAARKPECQTSGARGACQESTSATVNLADMPADPTAEKTVAREKQGSRQHHSLLRGDDVCRAGYATGPERSTAELSDVLLVCPTCREIAESRGFAQEVAMTQRRRRGRRLAWRRS